MARNKFSSPTLNVRIAPEAYERAVKSKSGGCLIADQIKDQYPHLSKVTVDMATIRVSDRKDGKRYTYLTPSSAQHLLLSFDQGWPNPIDEVVLKRAVVVTPITRARYGNNSKEERAAARAAKIAELEAKVAAGEDLTRGEASALAKMRNAKEAPDRPSTTGPKEVKVTDNRGVVVHGAAPKQGEPHPNLLRGSDRHFGAKLADPGIVFKQAVEEAVKQRLESADS